jgi:hypothetical protein
MSKKLEGKVAVIIGGNIGILATARRFVAEGADVFITGRRQPELDEAVRQIGGNVTGVRGDASNLGDLDRLFGTVKQQQGRLDVLFANAGVLAARVEHRGSHAGSAALDVLYDHFIWRLIIFSVSCQLGAVFVFLRDKPGRDQRDRRVDPDRPGKVPIPLYGEGGAVADWRVLVNSPAPFLPVITSARPIGM